MGMLTIDGNEAAARTAYRTNEVLAIYPITPASPMGEWPDAWAARGLPNIWGTVPQVTEMQSEGGAAGAIHGALQAGALAATFTASQGLLLMIPNMYKIAGELTPTVFHIAARTVATHALSIFGDHSDVMATRQTGWGMIFSGSVQECHDFALIAQLSSLSSRVPFLHVLDGFRTSHEVMKIKELTDDEIRSLIDDDDIRLHRERGLSPDRPVLRGTAQNPDVFFQAREGVNPFYEACPGIVEEKMKRFKEVTGRSYSPFDYIGDPEADRVIVMMGSGAEAAHECVEALAGAGEAVGLIKVRLYRPFSPEAFVSSLGGNVKVVATLDRTKEPGCPGEPLYLDVASSLASTLSNAMPRVIGGRYGLSSKEFTPAMIKGIFDEMKKEVPKEHFTIGIKDDLTGSSLDYDPSFSTEDKDVFRGLFFGLGSDGTVGANKNSIKIIGENTDLNAQGYFVYDSKKAGSMTVSHLRFGPRPIRSTYLISEADFVACHHPSFLERFDILEKAREGAVFLLNTPVGPDDVWDTLPVEYQEKIIGKGLKVHVIDASRIAKEVGMGGRVNTILQTCFFAISGVLPRDEAIEAIKKAIEKTYGKKGEAIVKMNYDAVDRAVENLHEIKVPSSVTSARRIKPPVSEAAPEFVRNVLGEIIAGRGDDLPVSAFPPDGTFPTGTTRWEKRNIALEIPVWDPEICIQCNKCVISCPHASIRSKVAPDEAFAGAPETMKKAKARPFREYPAVGKEGWSFVVQVAPEDCVGCGLCAEVCPAKKKDEPKRKALMMAGQQPLRESESANWDFFLSIQDPPREEIDPSTVKGSQFLRPFFEFSGACAGCGETPYVKLLSQLFGKRAIIANATGCSSIYGGNLPTTPWAHDNDGRGPAWSNSLFEDNAEFGLGFRLTNDKEAEQARELVEALRDRLDPELAGGILDADQNSEAGIIEQRDRVKHLREALAGIDDPRARRLSTLADFLVKRSIWIVGGDGWAYDIGYGGLDHVLASGRNVNLLVLDTEVYSNTGGQASKATPRAAVAKFAAAGKPLAKKDLALMAMTYGNVYVARVALGANDLQTVRAFTEAEAHDGPSIIIAYCHCIAHGYDLRRGFSQQKAAVESGQWPIFRFNPALRDEGKNPFILDARPPKIGVSEYASGETRFKMLAKTLPERAKSLMGLAQEDSDRRWAIYSGLVDLYEPKKEAE